MNMTNYYRQLVGAKITKFKMVKGPHDYKPYPTYWVDAPNGDRLRIEVSQDEEGNGPGFLFIGEGDKA